MAESQPKLGTSLSVSHLMPSGPVLNQTAPWAEPTQCRIRVGLPQGQNTVLQVDFSRTMREIRDQICSKRGLSTDSHVLYIQLLGDQGVESVPIVVDLDRRLDAYSNWKMFILKRTGDPVTSSLEMLGPPGGSATLSKSTNNLNAGNGEPMPGGRRRSVLNAPTSQLRHVAIRHESGVDGGSPETDRVSKGFAMGSSGATPYDTVSRRSGTGTLRAISTMLMGASKGQGGASAAVAAASLSADDTQSLTITTPTGHGGGSEHADANSPSSAFGSLRSRMSSSKSHDHPTGGGVHRTGIATPELAGGISSEQTSSTGGADTPDRDNASISGASTFRDDGSMKRCDSEDIKIITKRALFAASRDLQTSGSDSASPSSPKSATTLLRTSHLRSSNGSRYATLRKSGATSPTKMSADSPLTVRPGVHIYEAGHNAPAPPPDAPTTLTQVTVTLPSMLNLYWKVGDEVTVEQLLSHVCAVQKLPFQQLSLDLVCSTIGVEMDRTIKYYVASQGNNAFNVVNKPKRYNNIVITENEAETLSFQNQDGRLVVMLASIEKLVEIFTVNPDYYDIVGVNKPANRIVPSATMTSVISAMTAPHPMRLRTSSNNSTADSASTSYLTLGNSAGSGGGGESEPSELYDYDLLDTFLMTFRSLMKPAELFEALIAQFNAELPEQASEEDVEYFSKHKLPTQIRAVQVLGIWVEAYFIDFALDSALRNELLEFLLEIGSHLSFRELSMAIQETMEQKSDDYERLINDQRGASQKSKTMDSMIMAYSAVQVAQQLSLYDQRLFKVIHPTEYLNEIFVKKVPDETQTPSLDFFSSRCDLESHWVATEILMVKDVKRRAAVMSQFIEIGWQCLQLNNFFSMLDVYSGLTMRPVERLAKTWKQMSDDDMAKFEEMKKTCDPSKNMLNMRKRQDASKAPIIPCLPLSLKDLVFANDGNKTHIRGLINVDKLRSMSMTVKRIMECGSVRYAFPGLPALQNYLKKPPAERDFKKLKEWSKELESDP
ncbi:ras guanine nucleotide exchange factor domain-containing protein [Blastocladiella britannica]|nr:ras guanine nucleotide exchange factor domain-containing protein [Blastocladiella britannica]